jgi:hypothetical protein
LNLIFYNFIYYIYLLLIQFLCYLFGRLNHNFKVGSVKSFVDDLIKELGIVSTRVGLPHDLLRFVLSSFDFFNFNFNFNFFIKLLLSLLSYDIIMCVMIHINILIDKMIYTYIDDIIFDIIIIVNVLLLLLTCYYYC